MNKEETLKSFTDAWVEVTQEFKIIEEKRNNRKKGIGMKIRVDTKYDVYGYTEVELPEGKTMDDINHIWMKWCEGHIEFKDGTIEERYFEDDQEQNHEWFKRPVELTFEECDDCEIETEK